MRPSVRLAALMNIPTTFVWTHDSIGLGEDGPTHQPIEHLAALRAIPNFATIRPADANEVAQAWKSILLRQQPAGILLSRQNLPVFDRTICASAEGVDKGAYVLVTAPKKADVVLIATGSEVSLAVKSAETLNAQGISTQVVSAPCLEWSFRIQALEDWLTTLEEAMVDENNYGHRRGLEDIYFSLKAAHKKHQAQHETIVTDAPTADDLQAYLMAYAAAITK
jgi:transketolase